MSNEYNDFDEFDDFSDFNELSNGYLKLSRDFMKAVAYPARLRSFAKKAPELTKDQQLALGRIIQDNETSLKKKDAAVEMLIISGLQLIFYHIHSCSNRDLYEELIQTGMAALTKSAYSFDPSRNVLFTTYANKPVKSAIASYYSGANKLLHMSKDVRRDAKKIQKLEMEACGEFGGGNSLTNREIAEKLDMDEDKVMCIRLAQRTERQIIDSALYDQDNAINSWEYSACDSSASKSVLGKSDVEVAFSKWSITARLDEILGEKDALIVKMHYGLDGNQALTVKEIAEKLHQTPAQISYQLRVSRQQLRLDRELRAFFELD